MAEYSREQRYQLSRAVANSESGSKQLKGFVDNRSNVCGRTNTIKSFPNKKCPIQRFVIEEGDKRILSTTKDESGKIAEVEKGRSTYIEFSNNYQNYLVDGAKAVIGEKQRITSFDYLNKMMEKSSKSESESPGSQTESVYKVRREKWLKHARWYETIMDVLDACCVFFPVSNVLIDEILHNKSMYLYYAGTDAVGAALSLPYKKPNEKQAAPISLSFPVESKKYINEIEIRLKEMECEKQVCLEQFLKKHPAKAPALYNDWDDNDHGSYWGRDCREFALIGNDNFDLPMFSYSGNQKANDAEERAQDESMKGYSYHVWNELTRDVLTEGGVATVETCAGKGGILRAVFDIRQTTVEGIKNDIVILNQQGGEHEELYRKSELA